MNNLPLQPINWRTFKSIVGVSCDATTPICEYDVWQSDGSWVVEYYNRQTEEPTKIATGFATIDESKAWAWNHYNEKMQPYVVPMPTWIDASERLPEEGGKYLVCFGLLKSAANSDVDNFNAKTKQWEFYNKDDLPRVIAWMPIPEFSTMKIIKENDCD